jgi:hypothetical protein
VAISMMAMLKRRVFDDASLSEPAMMVRGKVLAAWSLVVWAGAITAGRLLAYTYSYLTYSGNG